MQSVLQWNAGEIYKCLLVINISARYPFVTCLQQFSRDPGTTFRRFKVRQKEKKKKKIKSNRSRSRCCYTDFLFYEFHRTIQPTFVTAFCNDSPRQIQRSNALIFDLFLIAATLVQVVQFLPGIRRDVLVGDVRTPSSYAVRCSYVS